jgi:hypothetical protein
MAIVQAGKQFTTEDLQRTAGDLASHLVNFTQDATDFASQVATWTDADLLALGLEQAEIDAIKGFYLGDLPAVHDALAASTWIRQLLGLGV